MRRRMTEILSDDSITSTGETFTVELPSDFTVTALALTMDGANVTDEATLAELQAGLGTIEVITKNGQPWRIEAEDLYYINKYLFGYSPYVSKQAGSGSDNDIRYITEILPLNPLGPWNPQMGVTPESKGKVRVVCDSDTNAGADARSLTITALGIEGAYPETFMGAYEDAFTAIAGENFRDIQSDRVNGMMGIFAFLTTGFEDLTSSNAPGPKHIGWAVNKSLKAKVKGHVCDVLFANVDDNNAQAAPVSDYVLLDTGLDKGEYIPYVDGLQAYINAGVVEALRVYPLLNIRNG